eukprot:5843120-Pyramimonas_sp.AAC.1
MKRKRRRRGAAGRPGHLALAAGNHVATPSGIERATGAEVGESAHAGDVGGRAAELDVLGSDA